MTIRASASDLSRKRSVHERREGVAIYCILQPAIGQWAAGDGVVTSDGQSNGAF